MQKPEAVALLASQAAASFVGCLADSFVCQRSQAQPQPAPAHTSARLWQPLRDGDARAASREASNEFTKGVALASSRRQRGQQECYGQR